MSSRQEQGINTEPIEPRDKWSVRWVDPSLQSLGRWMEDNSFSDSEAEHAVSRVYSYYSYFVVPTYDGYPDMGISVRSNDNKKTLVLTLPETAAQNGSPVDKEKLANDLNNYERRPVNPNLSLQVEIGGTESVEIADEIIGTYKDDLVAQLGLVMNPHAVQPWLDAPNSRFMGETPRTYIGNPQQDGLIRDLIFDVIMGQPS